MSKYHNRRVQIDGLWFDSQAEGRRYAELRLLEKAGAIADLLVHPRYELIPKHTDRAGQTYPAVIYEGDFQYGENGHLVVEDVKGFRTDAFIIKRKLFTWLYPGIVFRIVEAE